jgi:hypothetical protein
MGGIADAIGKDVAIPAEIVKGLDTSAKMIIRNVDREIGEGTALLQDTERGVIKVADNLRADAGYTIRDTKDQLLVTIDSAVDNLALVVDRQTTNLFDTVQVGVLLGLSVGAIFLVLYGDDVFKNGVKIGTVSLI